MELQAAAVSTDVPAHPAVGGLQGLPEETCLYQ